MFAGRDCCNKESLSSCRIQNGGGINFEKLVSVETKLVNNRTMIRWLEKSLFHNALSYHGQVLAQVSLCSFRSYEMKLLNHFPA